ncbi:transglycosylase SLT domain-containing protein [Streptomyces bohaiensis]|uniref:transglycosylase SLT domain-containing protein n=1 Tax=Streptomyces bohaiensis TaxID=1431344 RepID=UPI003B7D6C37
MPARQLSRRLQVTQKTATASLALSGAAILAFTVVPGPAAADERPAQSLSTEASAWDLAGAAVPAQRDGSDDVRTLAEESLRDHAARQAAQQQAAEESQQALAEVRRAEAEHASEAEQAAKQLAADEKAAAEREAAEQPASRSAEREAPVVAAAEPAQPAAEPEPEPAKTYEDNLEGWIAEALDIMSANGIPGSYDGLHRNIMRESSGNPQAINDWDINWINGTPSMGLLQVIQPTFDAYHVDGTPHDVWHPVANLVAAANYAWDRYGSIDNVDGPY